MPSRIWFPLLAKNGFRLSFSRVHMAIGATCFMPMSDLLALTQYLVFGRKIEKTSLVGPPVFVLGHWRSGTTLLHEYMAMDDRFASPTTFQCFAPWHFLLTEDLITKYGGFLLPERRPMDNMKAGWDLPQEDEFALMNLGAPTPYLRLLCPLHEIPYEDTLGSKNFRPENLAKWKRLFDWFLRALTFKSGKQLILKSPPHTGRLGILREMYPEAKFVHITRDPRKLFPSTMKLWRSLDNVQSLQVGDYDASLKQFVFRSLKTMYESFEEDRKDVPSNQLVDVAYEDLVVDPLGVVQKIYSNLELGGFERLVPLLNARVHKERDYQTNRLEMTPEEEREVMTEWNAYAKAYGYTVDPISTPSHDSPSRVL